MGVIAKRSSMIFFSNPKDHYCHRVRIVMAEKDVTVVIKNVDNNENLALLADYNPYNSLPTLVDRDLMLYNSNIIMEYLDERFPHPPLLPAYPVSRSQTRLMIHRIEKDICVLFNGILNIKTTEQQKSQYKDELIRQLLAIAPVFKSTYFMSEEFSLLDCCLLPILWRLPSLGIDLPKSAMAINEYANNLFQKETFQKSLSDEEKEMFS